MLSLTNVLHCHTRTASAFLPSAAGGRRRTAPTWNFPVSQMFFCYVQGVLSIVLPLKPMMIAKMIFHLTYRQSSSPPPPPPPLRHQNTGGRNPSSAPSSSVATTSSSCSTVHNRRRRISCAAAAAATNHPHGYTGGNDGVAGQS